jgi:hypothetical protein
LVLRYSDRQPLEPALYHAFPAADGAAYQTALWKPHWTTHETKFSAFGATHGPSELSEALWAAYITTY